MTYLDDDKFSGLSEHLSKWQPAESIEAQTFMAGGSTDGHESNLES